MDVQVTVGWTHRPYKDIYGHRTYRTHKQIIIFLQAESSYDQFILAFWAITAQVQETY